MDDEYRRKWELKFAKRQVEARFVFHSILATIAAVFIFGLMRAVMTRLTMTEFAHDLIMFLTGGLVAWIARRFIHTLE